VGTERVMYGSDAPFHHPAVEILRVQVSGLNAGELEDVLHRSGRRLFFRDDVEQKEEVTSLEAMG
jgi:uncharacterized protein